MATTNTPPVTTSPKTAAQLRVVIDRLRLSIAETGEGTFEGGESDVALGVGELVYAPTSAHIDLADASALATSRVIGISTTVTAIGEEGRIQTSGIVTISGASFTTNSIYYLSEATPGLLTLTAPTTVGQTVVAVAIAISTEKLRLLSVPPILL